MVIVETTTRQRTSQLSTIKCKYFSTVTEEKFNRITKTSPGSTSIVFYSVAALLTVFVVFSLFYAASYLPKFLSCLREEKSPELDIEVDENNSLHYEDPPFP